MKQIILLCSFTLLFTSVRSQNIGVGTLDPQSLLHVMNGNLRFEGNSKYFDFHTGIAAQTGMRFYADGLFKGAWFYNTNNQNINLTSNGNIKGLIYDLGSNRAFIGRDFGISSAEKFGVSRYSSTPSYGGMYMETFGNSGGKPFYGYAIDSTSRAWHYFDGVDATWKLNVSGDRVFVKNTGLVGIGEPNPLDLLHIDGDVRIEGTSPTLKLYQGTTYGSYVSQSGQDMIVSNVEAGKLFLRTNNTSKMTIDSDGRVGIGDLNPSYMLDISSNQPRGIYIDNTYDGTTAKYGGFFNTSSAGSSSKYGVYAAAVGNNGSSFVYGGRFLANGSGNTGNVYGIYAQVSAPGTGNHYGIYTTASTTNPGTNSRSWALYAQGHSYFSNDVRIGTIQGATGYKLSVAGKIMSEELKVQLVGDWPDYVFEPEYKALSISEIDGYIKEHKHLPGVPSALDVQEEGGILVGEMNRILLEKVEELTLLLIEQNQKIEALKAEVDAIKTK